jgi:hypothetical protein
MVFNFCQNKSKLLLIFPSLENLDSLSSPPISFQQRAGHAASSSYLKNGMILATYIDVASCLPLIPRARPITSGPGPCFQELQEI